MLDLKFMHNTINFTKTVTLSHIMCSRATSMMHYKYLLHIGIGCRAFLCQKYIYTPIRQTTSPFHCTVYMNCCWSLRTASYCS